MAENSARYWWVNHKQTSKQEIDGGFLWSPITESNGNRSQFYDNMRRARPGDRVVSYSNAMVSFVGMVSDYCLPYPKPSVFGVAGEAWSNAGWLLPVTWMPVAKPLRVKDEIDNIGPLLPTKYSPVQARTGNGNQKAYLAEISEKLFKLLLDLTVTEPRVIGEASNEIRGSAEYDHEYLTEGETKRDLTDTVSSRLRETRVGQAKFRANVIKVEKRCRFSHLSNPMFLVASHIKPWRVCQNADERWDGNNGLLLTPNLDRLFDRGLMTILPDGEVCFSEGLPPEILSAFAVESKHGINVGEFSEAQRGYLEFHNRFVFVEQF